MLTELLPELLADAGGVPRLEPGRCLRSRFSKISCRRCTDACPAAAIDGSDRLPLIRATACTGCSLCQAACPTGALGEPAVLNRVVADLDDQAQPVIGCFQPGVRAHTRVPCVGLFDEEALLALAILFPSGLTFDLTRCATCANVAAMTVLRHRLAALAALPEFPCRRLRLAETEAEVGFSAPAVSRREFFAFFRNRSARAVGSTLRRLQPPLPESYGAKRLPAGRRLLLRTLPLLASSLRSAAEERFFPTLNFSPECRRCTSCVGVCPTGALATSSDDPPQPVFEAALCTGCAACAEFCRRQAIAMGGENHASLPIGAD
jgi:ferredoxin